MPCSTNTGPIPGLQLQTDKHAYMNSWPATSMPNIVAALCMANIAAVLCLTSIRSNMMCIGQCWVQRCMHGYAGACAGPDRELEALPLLSIFCGALGGAVSVGCSDIAIITASSDSQECRFLPHADCNSGLGFSLPDHMQHRHIMKVSYASSCTWRVDNFAQHKVLRQ